jgi:DNA topoisomerase-2
MGPKTTTKKTSKSIEETYKKVGQVDHILLRPDTYIGDVKLQKEQMWVYSETLDKIVEKEINYVPGLYKIFDEVLVNAGDRVQEDSTCDTIKVNIDQSTNTISVWNNGLGIPVKIHQEHNLYVPSLIFGELLTSSNYDDSVERTTGGRNGYGAKLANIYSTFFSVETVDSEEKLKFYQEFKSNMGIKEEPKITKLKSDSPKLYTCITFQPDLSRFGLTSLTNDIVSLFKKRVYDMAGVYSTVNVWLNDKKISCPNFKKYIDMYKLNIQTPSTDTNADSDSDNELVETETSKGSKKSKSDLVGSSKSTGTGYEIIYEDSNPRWKIGVIYAPNNDFKQISFVNGICTYHGGTHVDYIVGGIIDKIKAQIAKKHKDLTVKPSSIKENMIVFINSIIINPAFTSQVKETLKTKEKEFGSTCELPEKFIKKIFASGIVDQVINLVKLKEQSLLKKTDGKKTTKIQGIPKLEDANWAGTKKSSQTYLILTEGDSAKALAMAGLAVVGQDRFGVFPLKGKLLNVREASHQQIMKNEEIANIKKILGLQQGKIYKDTSELRYSGIIIMTDADTDGHHIKGLLINFIHYFWPSLVQKGEFIFSLQTPIVKAFKGKKTLEFYNLTEYATWKESGSSTGWRIKYYKGLGTSTKEEAKQYFTGLDEKLLKYIYENQSGGKDNIKIPDETEVFAVGETEVNTSKAVKSVKSTKKTTKTTTGEDVDESDDDIQVVTKVERKYNDDTTEAITLAFEKDRSDHRKAWLMGNDKKKILPQSGRNVSIPNFINRELILFSYDDCDRSLPSVCDGLKPSQRKVLYGAFLKRLYKPESEIRVSQLAAYVSEKTAYHHGEASVVGTIVKMAQDFVGSNNVNVLVPSGAFGTRILGGEDHASARYIQTYVTPEITRAIYRELDEPVLNYLDDDGIPIEPEWFIPVIPMILVNGTKGIGTGFSTTVAKYSPIDIINNLLAMIDKKVGEIRELKPWYQGFKGTVLSSNKPGSYLIYGRYQVVDEITVRVTELPVGTWTNDYKEFLESEIIKKNIVSYTSNNTDETVEFTIVFDEDKLKKIINKKELYTKLKLVSRISTNNMWLYDPSGMIKKYSNPQDIINEFYQVRLSMYIKRKEWLIGKLTNELDILKYKMKFIKFVLDGKIVVFKQKRSVIIERLEELKFPKLATKQSSKVEITYTEDMELSESNSSKSYEYITSMPLFSLTEEKIDELQARLDEKEQELVTIQETSETDQWKLELNEVLEIYESWAKTKQEVIDTIASGKAPSKTTKSVKTTKRSTKTTKKSIDI